MGCLHSSSASKHDSAVVTDTADAKQAEELAKEADRQWVKQRAPEALKEVELKKELIFPIALQHLNYFKSELGYVDNRRWINGERVTIELSDTCELVRWCTEWTVQSWCTANGYDCAAMLVHPVRTSHTMQFDVARRWTPAVAPSAPPA